MESIVNLEKKDDDVEKNDGSNEKFIPSNDKDSRKSQ